MVRLDTDGNVVWRLPYATHHSIHENGSGNLWVCGLRVWDQRRPEYPNIEPGVRESVLLEVSPGGEILQEISVFDLLDQNDMNGLLYMSATEKNVWTPLALYEDPLHLNDIEEFPESLEAGFFEPGDVMISLRNINTVLVFSRSDWKVKLVRTGMMLNQHDPDFIDGNTISLYDNNRRVQESGARTSRILLLDANGDGFAVHYQGTEELPFYSNIMGKHQWLPNGNLLITEAMGGRAFEISPSGNIVWEYRNLLTDGRLGIVGEVTRIPVEYRAVFKKN